MRIFRIFPLLIVVSCHRPYQHAGDPPPLSVAGLYEMSETLYANDCPPAVGRAHGIEARKKKLRVEVRNSVPSTGLMMVVETEPFDGQVLPNGRFELKAVSWSRQNLSVKVNGNGRFTSTGFSARYIVETSEVMPQTRPGPAVTQICKYNFLWEAQKL